MAGTTLLVALKRRKVLAHPLTSALILGLSIYGLWAQSEAAIWSSVAVTIVGIVLPVRLFAKARKASQVGDFQKAALWIKRLQWIRKLPRLAGLQSLWQAAADFHQGQPSTAHALSAQLAAATDPLSHQLRESLMALTRDWERARYAMGSDLQARALCELGDVRAGVETSARLWGSKMSLPRILRARDAMLGPLAFAGRVESTERLTTLLRLPSPIRALWRSTALFGAGEDAKATATLSAIDREALPPPIQAALDARREAPPGAAELDESALAVITDVEAEINAGFLLRRRPLRQSPETALIVTAIVIMFGVQIALGGSTDLWVALRLGALTANGHMPVESWRLWSYGLLHYGIGHLLMNLMVLLLAGPIVEGMLGRFGLLVIFGGSVGLAGTAISLYGAHGITLGASGGAMALATSIWTMLRMHPALRRTRTGRAGSIALGGLLLLQVCTDLLIPGISFMGHLAGALSGIGLTLIWITTHPQSLR